VEGIKTVLKLRSEYGQPKKELTDPSRCYDLSYYEREPAALRKRGSGARRERDPDGGPMKSAPARDTGR
jgi:hypothetical protein